jgi:hypothetical protein
MKEEIASYISWAYDQEKKADLEDVYVTNHVPKQKQFVTTNNKEDEEFYRYKKAVREYNSRASTFKGQ